MDEKNVVIVKQENKKDSNTPALLGFIFSFLGCLAIPGLVLSIIGLVNSKKYKNGRKGLAIAGIVISSIIIIAAFSVYDPDNSNTGNNSVTNTSNTSKTETIYNIGDTITFKKYEVTIENVSTATEVGGEYFKTSPAEGGIFVCVDVKYKNISEEPIGMFSFPSFNLLDSKGTKYSADVSASSYYSTQKDPDRKVLSDLNPGITVTDNDVYEISTESYNNGEWYILIDKKVKVKIK